MNKRISPHILYLASSSQSRQILLKEAGIAYVAIGHVADESCFDPNQTLPNIVMDIARLKLQHAVLPPEANKGQQIFVLAADTLTSDNNGAIYGKPKSRPEAVATIKMVRNGAQIVTGFCLEIKEYDSDSWKTIKQTVSYASASCICDIPDSWIESYLNNTQALHASGSLAIEGFGALFVKSIQGAYSTILGLPMSELRQALDGCGFFDSSGKM